MSTRRRPLAPAVRAGVLPAILAALLSVAACGRSAAGAGDAGTAPEPVATAAAPASAEPEPEPASAGDPTEQAEQPEQAGTGTQPADVEQATAVLDGVEELLDAVDDEIAEDSDEG